MEPEQEMCLILEAKRKGRGEGDELEHRIINTTNIEQGEQEQEELEGQEEQEQL